MSDQPETPDPAVHPLHRIRWPLRLTRLGLLAERLVQSFWPVWTVALLLMAGLAFGLVDELPVEIAWAVLMFGLGAIVWGLVSGLRGFRWPGAADAVARLDASLPGRPLAALADTQAVGADDPASAEVWQAHRDRMAARAATAKPVEPDLKLARRDPYALRYVALLAFVLAVLFGSAWRLTVAGPLPAPGTAVAAGPTWEGWVQPPPYTGKPSLYLNDITQPDFSAPVGSKITLRLYGSVGTLTVGETVSGRTGVVESAATPEQNFSLARSGKLTINGPGGRSWQVTAVADQPPKVEILGKPDRKASGEMQLPFRASDDYGVVKGTATIELNLSAVDRRYGLAVPPEARAPIVLDLPMPLNGQRKDFTQVLVEDLSKNAWANLPVKITLTVQDAAGQSGSSAVMETDLPGRRFFDPLAAAVIEMRRDLLWSMANARRTDEILRAITYKPAGFIKNQKAYLLLRVAMRRLETGIDTGMTPAIRDEVAEALWQVALQFEDGTLSDALDRLRQAQEKLSEAIRRGASKDEIAKLMQDMNKALHDYVAKLAQEQQGKDQQTSQAQPGMTISGDQMQQLLDRLQQLMEQGRMAEAQQLLDRLQQMTQNMQVAQGKDGMQVPGGQSMQGLQDTLRQQQNLSDNTFQDLQNQFNQPGQQGQQGQQGQDGQQGQNGQQGQGGQSGGARPGQGGQQGGVGQDGTGQGGQSLADRQQALRDQLNRQMQGNLPGAGTDEGNAARDALGRAGQAMDQAEQALRNGDNAGALDKQAEAMDALRDGLHALDQAMNKGQPGTQGQAGQSDTASAAGPRGQSDPLGRQVGQTGSVGTGQNMLQGEDVYRRAREILDELRKRSGDPSRPTIERDYLKRLLQLF